MPRRARRAGRFRTFWITRLGRLSGSTILTSRGLTLIMKPFATRGIGSCAENSRSSACPFSIVEVANDFQSLVYCPTREQPAQARRLRAPDPRYLGLRALGVLRLAACSSRMVLS